MFANNPCHAILPPEIACTSASPAGRAILQYDSTCQRDSRKAKVAVCRRPGERRVEVPAMYLERALLQIGVSDIGMDRGEPVQRPALAGVIAAAAERRGRVRPRRRFEVDGSESGTPELAAQRHPLRRRNRSRCPTSAPRRSVRARARRAGSVGDGDAHEVLAPSLLNSAVVGPR